MTTPALTRETLTFELRQALVDFPGIPEPVLTVAANRILVLRDAEVEALRGQLGDPKYQYAGARIQRSAIEARNVEIANLLEEKAALRRDLNDSTAQLEADNLECVSLRAQARALMEELRVSHEIGNSFWAALKRLNLPALNVADPGQHFSELIDERDALRARVETAERERDEAREVTVSVLAIAMRDGNGHYYNCFAGQRGRTPSDACSRPCALFQRLQALTPTKAPAPLGLSGNIVVTRAPTDGRPDEVTLCIRHGLIDCASCARA